MKQDLEILQKFDLSENEIQIYTSLLRMGKSSVLNLSRYTGIKRSSVHHYTEQLISKGLILQTTTEGRRILVAEPPEKLHNLLETMRKDFLALKDNLPFVIQGLEEIMSKDTENMDLSLLYYSGKASIAKIYENALDYSEIFGILNTNKLLEIFPESANKYTEAFTSGRIKLRDIIIGEPTAMDIQQQDIPGYRMKFVRNKKIQYSLDLMLYEDHTIFINFNDIKPTAVVINNPTIYKSFKAMYMLLWDMLPEITI